MESKSTINENLAVQQTGTGNSTKVPGNLATVCIFIAVSLYMFFVGLFLIITRRVKPPASISRLILMSILRWLRLLLRKRASGTLTNIQPELGHCFITPIPGWIVSDSNGRSKLNIYENRELLGPAHSVHKDIRELGKGRYSHWAGYVLFSSSDNSDPGNNGRKYSFSE